jgi:hypothetical protein
MSLKQKTERAVRKVLQDAGVNLTFLLSQEAETITVALPLCNIQALDGPQFSPKTRIVKLRTLVAVRTSADKDPNDPNAAEPADLHAINVDAVTLALNVPNLATLLSAAVANFGCIGVIARGMGEAHPPQGERSLCDGFLYELWVMEGTIAP